VGSAGHPTGLVTGCFPGETLSPRWG
jgi:hypothetical protein